MAEPPNTTNNNSTTTTVRSLNDFPDHILLHVLSSFPTTLEAIETSLLSRKWRNLWLSTPSLNFAFYGSPFYLDFEFDELENLQHFANFVNRTLILRDPDSRLHTFSVQFNFNNGKFTSQVHSWIRYAVSHNARNLEVDLAYCHNSFMNTSENDARFEFRFSLLGGNSQVRVLKLLDCDLSLSLTNNSRFFSLWSISLVRVRLSDQMVKDLMVGCVNLELLALVNVQGWKNIKICSSKLRELSLEELTNDGGSLEINAPNLNALCIDSVHVEYVLKDVSSLVEASVFYSYSYYRDWIKAVTLLGHVKHLYSLNYWCELLQLKDPYSGNFILQNLKYVELGTFYRKSDLIGISVLLVLSPNLQTMVLINCSHVCRETLEQSISEDFKLPSLKHVKIVLFAGTECEKNLLSVLLKTGVVLKKITLIPGEDGVITGPPLVLDLPLNPCPEHNLLCCHNIPL